MKWSELDQQRCSVARAVSVIGDRWTLLVLRDCFLGLRRFEDFQQQLGIARPVLAERLRKLVDAGVLKKVAYQQAPVRHEYRLTAKGLDLHPVMMTLVHWGDVHMAGAAASVGAATPGPAGEATPAAAHETASGATGTDADTARQHRPLLHRHTRCGQLFDPVLVCSACGEPVSPRDVSVERGPGA